MLGRLEADWKLRFFTESDEGIRTAELLRFTGDLVGAEAAARSALKDAFRSHGPGFAETLPCLDVLGEILGKLEKEEGGVAAFGEALEISVRRVGDPACLTCLRCQNLGIGELCLGRPREALRIPGQVREVRERSAGIWPVCFMAALDAWCLEAVAVAETGREGEACFMLEAVVLAMERAASVTVRERVIGQARKNLLIARDLVSRGDDSLNVWVFLPANKLFEKVACRWPWENPGTCREDPAREMRGARDFEGAEAAARMALALVTASILPSRRLERLELPIPYSLAPTDVLPGRRREALSLPDGLAVTLAMGGRHWEALSVLEKRSPKAPGCWSPIMAVPCAGASAWASPRSGRTGPRRGWHSSWRPGKRAQGALGGSARSPSPSGRPSGSRSSSATGSRGPSMPSGRSWPYMSAWAAGRG
ncbi:MAG: hypothetical protein LBT40_13720 [Deltaproteobacteria bacterium]|jgi:hypothetical protein|nr:hypothetical protein [Deltaproteobacteria bacterium]